MASDHSASSAMILRIRRTPDPEPGPVDLARVGIIGVGFEGCGAMLEVWPTVEDRSWVEVEDRLGIDGDSVVWVSCMLGLGNTGTGGPLVMARDGELLRQADPGCWQEPGERGAGRVVILEGFGGHLPTDIAQGGSEGPVSGLEQVQVHTPAAGWPWAGY